MKLGITTWPTDYAIRPADLARAVEERGFESMLFPEHTHIPVSRRSPFPSGGELPKPYWHGLDPWIALTAAATVTTKLRLGTGVCLPVEHDPIVLAKVVASVDYLSGGRVLFGVGGGWNYEEMENHGTRPAQRWKVLRERIAAMRTIWTEDEAEYHGEFVDFERIWSWPKPAAPAGVPVLVGGDGPRTLQRVVEYGNEWMPPYSSVDALRERIADLQRLASEAGRQPIPVSVVGVPPKPEILEQLAEIGVHRSLFALRVAGADEVLPRLDRYAGLAA